MSKATDTLKFLAIHNSWRRGDETSEMQNPTEIGAAIDDAVNLLRKYDELDRQNTLLIEENEALKKELQFLRSQNSRWQLETSIINDILDGQYEPFGTDFDYETDLTHKIQKMMENKK